MNSKHILVALMLISVSTFSFAREYRGLGKSSNKGVNPGDGTAANCSAPVGREELSINNVRALIHTGGDMWWDLVGQARYEVPKGSGNTALFAGSLWLGGRDASGQLKVAALRFRSAGTDFWTGPLNTVTAEIDPSSCQEWDTHFKTTRTEVDQFIQASNGITVPGWNGPSEVIKNWPAHGDPAKQEDWNLAPFYDVNDDGFYNWEDGDYPGYDIGRDVDCGGKLVNLYGDENLWWIFNDKGNIHTETGGQAIGMEIRAQAFSFATNDEVNNMTFYNYELVNRSTFELRDTYFGFWVDADLGNPTDDYVGCDVERGLGFAYNGDEFDEDAQGASGYGYNPPAIGADFFQGPFQDADLKDNCLCDNYADAIADDGVVYDGSGVGYGDSIVDNERLGMRAFLYHNNAGGTTGDPSVYTDYYNYLRSFWRDNSRMVYGGNGQRNHPLADASTIADFMFPGNSDPLGWGTQGVAQREWTEVTEAITPQDRRFIQSAGPFTLAPGAVNNITVGIVWARATSGGALASVSALKQADTKTQALFDACFQLLDGPDAPELEITELENELIIKISSSIGNNIEEGYDEIDPFIAVPDTFEINGTVVTKRTDPILYDSLSKDYSSYRFQGYQVYQLKDPSVSSADLYNEDKARLVFQCDIKDDVTDLINFRFDKDLKAEVPESRVANAVNDGVFKTFSLKEDAFAVGDKKLVNYRTYYFMAIAYAHNNYKTYNQGDPFALDGQKTPYLPSRKSPIGPIIRYSGIPRKAVIAGDPADVNVEYGQLIPVTRLEGMGNTGNGLEMDRESREQALVAPGYKVTSPVYNSVTKDVPGTPIIVKVVDPINVQDGNYTIYFTNDSTGSIDKAGWFLVGDNVPDTIFSKNDISLQKEEVIPSLGISVTIKDVEAPGVDKIENGTIRSTIEFENPSDAWLSGVSHSDGQNAFSWIRSGNFAPEGQEQFWDYDYTDQNTGDDDAGLDIDEKFEDYANGTWAPFRLATWHTHGPASVYDASSKNASARKSAWSNVWKAIPSSITNKAYALGYLHSVDVVFTSDKSKWTRSVVLEMQDDPSLSEGNAEKLMPRAHKSVDKAGLTSDDAGYNAAEGDLVSAEGMGWFPGYAVDLETGERLNIAFGEDSYLSAENGSDMVWNPTSNITLGAIGNTIRFGGKHFVYVFRNADEEDEQHLNPSDYNVPENRMPSYDEGKFMFEKLALNTEVAFNHVYRSAMWTGMPVLAFGKELLTSEATVKLRVNKPFQRYANNDLFSVGDELIEGEEYLVNKGPISYDGKVYNRGQEILGVSGATIEAVPGSSGTLTDNVDNVSSTVNGGRPTYGFEMQGFNATPSSELASNEIMDKILAVPNPYYAYSEYEADKNDYKILITNVPSRAKIKIFTMNGVLVREFEKDDESISYVEWDLKNFARIQVGSGMYLIHVEVPGVGEKVIKWFGVLRPVDLDSF